jgi:hypothetical protein
MKLPSVKPIEENYLCRTREDFKSLLSKTLSEGTGGLFKMLGKVGEVPYYVTILVDDQKILAIEAEEISSGKKLVGDEAVSYLLRILENPTIVDAYPLDDIGVKMSVIDNIDVYNRTPKLMLSEFLGEMPPITTEKKVTTSPQGQRETQQPSTVEELYKSVTKEVEEKLKKKEKPAKQKLELKLDVPLELDPYFRGLVKRLDAYGRSIGVHFRRVEVKAKEIRYALGSGVGINTYITVDAESESVLPPSRLENMLREQAYKEAGELSSELKKRVVISDLKLRLL